MTKYIALLRGINVGGHRKIPMQELKQQLIVLGFAEVETYIQSGNVVFKTSESDSGLLETEIRKVIYNQFGFDVAVIIKTPEQLQHIFNTCPFDAAVKQQTYFAMLSDIPKQTLIELAEEKQYENDVYHIIDDCIYLYPKLGYGRSKFNLKHFEKILNVEATARNYKTMLKLLAMTSNSK